MVNKTLGLNHPGSCPTSCVNLGKLINLFVPQLLRIKWE